MSLGKWQLHSIRHTSECWGEPIMLQSWDDFSSLLPTKHTITLAMGLRKIDALSGLRPAVPPHPKGESMRQARLIRAELTIRDLHEALAEWLYEKWLGDGEDRREHSRV